PAARNEVAGQRGFHLAPAVPDDDRNVAGAVPRRVYQLGGHVANGQDDLVLDQDLVRFDAHARLFGDVDVDARPVEARDSVRQALPVVGMAVREDDALDGARAGSGDRRREGLGGGGQGRAGVHNQRDATVCDDVGVRVVV